MHCDRSSAFQYKLRRLLESIIFRLIIAVLFLGDLVIIIVSVVRDFQGSELHDNGFSTDFFPSL